jgi:acetolactate synthase I/II/III large subunit
VSLAETDYRKTRDINLRSYRPNTLGHPLQVKKAVSLINSAQRPLIIAGGGVIAADACDDLRRLMEKAGILMVYTLMGKGAFPDGHPLNLGMLGMHGSAYANYAARGCDLLIAVGMRFSDRVTGKTSAFAPNAQIIHIDIDPAEIGKMLRPTVPIVGDAKNVLFALAGKGREARHDEWLAQLDEWRRTHRARQTSADGRIAPLEVFRAINELTDGEAVVATDVGQHQMWAAQFIQTKAPRRFLSSGGLGTMGFGLPAAIGAQIAFPDQTVFVIAGDGSILMNNQEIMTAVEQRLPVKVAIFNNGYLGMVRQWQQIFYDRRYASTDISAQPDFVKLAEAYGAAGLRAKTKEDVRPALKEAMKITDRPCLIDFHIAREACVLPMIPTGGTVDDMLLELD